MMKKANVKVNTCDIICGNLKCFCCFSNKGLRNSVAGRKELNYRLGEDQINKELDIGVIMKKLRQFNYFIKTKLTKN